MTTINTRRTLAIIPARGGSKRIPNKNIIDFLGKPMIIWTLEAAKKSGLFTQIIVTTDSLMIKKIVEGYGFSAIIRPAELATDKATLGPVTIDVFSQLEARKMFFDNACMLMPNCPLRNEADIINSFNAFKETRSNYLMSVFEYGMFYPFWALKMTKNGLEPFFGRKYIQTRSQDLPKVYCPTGAIRWVNIDAFKKDKDFYGENLQPYVMKWENSIDIDDERDLKMAEKLARSHLNF